MNKMGPEQAKKCRMWWTIGKKRDLTDLTIVNIQDLSIKDWDLARPCQTKTRHAFWQTPEVSAPVENAGTNLSMADESRWSEKSVAHCTKGWKGGSCDLIECFDTYICAPCIPICIIFWVVSLLLPALIQTFFFKRSARGVQQGGSTIFRPQVAPCRFTWWISVTPPRWHCWTVSLGPKT